MKIHQLNKIALNYTISQGIHNWSAKISITGWKMVGVRTVQMLAQLCQSLHNVYKSHAEYSMTSLPPPQILQGYLMVYIFIVHLTCTQSHIFTDFIYIGE